MTAAATTTGSTAVVQALTREAGGDCPRFASAAISPGRPRVGLINYMYLRGWTTNIGFTNMVEAFALAEGVFLLGGR